VSFGDNLELGRPRQRGCHGGLIHAWWTPECLTLEAGSRDFQRPPAHASFAPMLSAGKLSHSNRYNDSVAAQFCISIPVSQRLVRLSREQVLIVHHARVVSADWVSRTGTSPWCIVKWRDISLVTLVANWIGRSRSIVTKETFRAANRKQS